MKALKFTLIGFVLSASFATSAAVFRAPQAAPEAVEPSAQELVEAAYFNGEISIEEAQELALIGGSDSGRSKKIQMLLDWLRQRFGNGITLENIRFGFSCAKVWVKREFCIQTSSGATRDEKKVRCDEKYGDDLFAKCVANLPPPQE